MLEVIKDSEQGVLVLDLRKEGWVGHFDGVLQSIDILSLFLVIFQLWNEL